MQREGVSAEKARQMVLNDDEERRRWALSLYAMDTSDPTLYDMFLHIGALKVNDAARIVAETARLSSFQMTPNPSACSTIVCWHRRWNRCSWRSFLGWM